MTQSRRLELVSRRPQLGVPIRISANTVVVYESYGREWKLDDDTQSMGFHPQDSGRYVCYCYYRMATDDEIATMAHPEVPVYPIEDIEVHRFSDDESNIQVWGMVDGVLVSNKGYDRNGMTPELREELVNLPWEREVDEWGQEGWKSIQIATPSPAMWEALQIGTQHRVPSVESIRPERFR